MKPCGAAKTTDAQFIADGSKENTDNNSDAVQSQHKTDLEHMNNGGRSGSSQRLTILWIHGLNCGLEGLLGSKRAYKPTLVVEMGCIWILPRGGIFQQV